MDSEPAPLYIILLILSIFITTLLSLGVNVFPAVDKFFDPLRSPKKLEENVHQFLLDEQFIRGASILRIFFASFCYFLFFMGITPSINLPVFASFLVFFLLFHGIAYFLPKSIATARAERLLIPTYYLFAPFVPFAQLFGSFVLKLESLVHRSLGYDKTLAFLTDQEQEKIENEESKDPEALEEEEKRMIRNIIEYGDTPVQEVMTPRPDMVCLQANQHLASVIHFINIERHSRIPVYEDTQDNIIGILHTKDFFEWYTKEDHKGFDLRNLVRPAKLVSHLEKIDDVMRELRLARTHMAIVIDEYGGTDGLITLEDILEEIVGEIFDEDDDNDARIQQIQDSAWIVQPSIAIEELMQALQHPLDFDENSGIETFAGLIQITLGQQPRRGQKFELQGLKVKILRLHNQRIQQVLIEKIQEEAPAEA